MSNNPSDSERVSLTAYTRVAAHWVHAYDIADLFVASLTASKARGKRLIACAGRLAWAQCADILRKEFPDRPYPPPMQDALTVNFPGAEATEYDTELEKELLGGSWRSVDDAVLTCGRDLIAKEAIGWDKPVAA